MFENASSTADPTQAADTALACRWVSSPNFTARRPETTPPRRPDMLILHYTAMTSAERALHWLTVPESNVSCHYLIAEDGEIFQMVREANRAWQAGLSCWQGDEDINSASIGIEIANPGPESDAAAFPAVQMEAVRDLSLDICARNNIPQARVLAHSDIAPGRKTDPGPLFDWEWLAQEGVGLWPATNTEPDREMDARTCQQRLADIGYQIDITGEWDERTRTVLSAFQLHWRREKYDGVCDAGTVARLTDVWAMLAAVA